MDRIFFLLSGDGVELGKAEIRAIHRTYGLSYDIVYESGRVLIISSGLNVDLVRAAYVKEKGPLVCMGRGLEPEEIRRYFSNKSKLLAKKFKVDSEGFGEEKRKVDEDLGWMVLEAVRGAKVDVRRPEFVLRALKEGENVYVWINFIGKKERWSERFPRRRAFFHPSALTPRVARFMVNLTCSTDLLFDPFVGTGSTLIEAGLIGAYVVGSDIDLRMVKGCKANLEQFKVYGDVLQADARALPFRKVRAVACDLPYGRASSTYGENVSYIMERFLRELKRTLDGRAVVMYPEGVRPIIPEGLKVEEEFKLYVHKSLTRRVSVIGRVD